jgi:hypothetical protein
MKGLGRLPSNTVMDGEVAALGANGRPDFSHSSTTARRKAPLAYVVFDLMVLGGRDVRKEPLGCRHLNNAEARRPQVLQRFRERRRLQPGVHGVRNAGGGGSRNLHPFPTGSRPTPLKSGIYAATTPGQRAICSPVESICGAFAHTPRQANDRIWAGNWRRRPDLNRGWRFCRFNEVVNRVVSC